MRRRLPETYLSPLPVFPPRAQAVREFNTGEVWRESSVHGIHRAWCGSLQGEPRRFLAQIGDYVYFKLVEPSSGRVVFHTGRVKALYVSYEAKELAASLRVCGPPKTSSAKGRTSARDRLKVWIRLTGVRGRL